MWHYIKQLIAMTNFSENYKLRKYYLHHDQVPTQSMMKQKMSPTLAALLYNSLTPKLKVIAGIEPPLKGAGSDWYVSPEQLLVERRTVLKPLKHEFLTKLSHLIMVERGPKILMNHFRNLDAERNKMLLESDMVWKQNIAIASTKHYEDCVALNKKLNTDYLDNAFSSFSSIYRTNFTNIEKIIHEESISQVNEIRKQAILQMQNRYATFLKTQALLMIGEFTAKLEQEKARLKAQFIEHAEISRTNTASNIHDLNADKHVAIGRLRKYFQCQSLACQIYVSLKERETCINEIETSEHKHKKNEKFLSEYIALENIQIGLAEQKERKRKVLDSIWLKKICHLVKELQMFVLYCLKSLPDHAEFFINMEKLMLLQINKVLEDPDAESIIVAKEEPFQVPVPKPNPFYLFCDRGYKTKVDQNLCPKHGSSSSESQLPVIIINKRCLYAACDNFEQFTDKIKDFINRTDADIKDEFIYEDYVPVKYTLSQQLSELKLESSILQLLQTEMRNIRKLPSECAVCKMPLCFCTSNQDKETTTGRNESIVEQGTTSNAAHSATSMTLLQHETEPKLGSYLKYIEPRKCACGKRTNLNLEELLPMYMRKICKYETPNLPNYKMCSAATLKKLVQEARDFKGEQTKHTPPIKNPSNMKDMSTQYSDHELNLLCTCKPTACYGIKEDEVVKDFSKIGLKNKIGHATTADQFYLEASSPSYMVKQTSSFATDRAHSLRRLIDDTPELMEVFAKNKDC